MESESKLTTINSFHKDLRTVKELLYDKCGICLTDLKLDPESVEYGACSFTINGKKVEHRISKITPIKTGQFVTIWKRNKNGITQPFDISDDLDFIIITTRSISNFGQFIFPKFALEEKDILSKKGKGGKRGIRVYPPWDTPINLQAKKTQHWQTQYFLRIDKPNQTDFNLIRKLFGQPDE